MEPDLSKLKWFKSSKSGPNSDMCVEVAKLDGGGAAVRHSKDPDGGVLLFTAGEWTAFLEGATHGEFNF